MPQHPPKPAKTPVKKPAIPKNPKGPGPGDRPVTPVPPPDPKRK